MCPSIVTYSLDLKFCLNRYTIILDVKPANSKVRNYNKFNLALKAIETVGILILSRSLSSQDGRRQLTVYYTITITL